MSENTELMKYVATTCPYCGVGCTLNLVVNNGKVVGVDRTRDLLSMKENSVQKE
jgi:predicted molibdopterin-dependent oxidoreductase YjgC